MPCPSTPYRISLSTTLLPSQMGEFCDDAEDDFDADDCVPMCKIPTGSTCDPFSWDSAALDEDVDDDAASATWGAGDDDGCGCGGPGTDATISFRRDPGFFGTYLMERQEPSKRSGKEAVRAYLRELQQPGEWSGKEEAAVRARLVEPRQPGEWSRKEAASTCRPCPGSAMRAQVMELQQPREWSGKEAVRAHLMELQQPAWSPSPGPERELAPPGPAALTSLSPVRPVFAPPIPRKWMAQIVEDMRDDSGTGWGGAGPAPPIATPPGLAPPGLAPPPPAAPPSLGSRLHDAGLCKPCGWFRKPGGCKNGQLCHHCHICSRDDVKMRKTRKVQALKNKAQQTESLEQGVPVHVPSRRFSV